MQNTVNTISRIESVSDPERIKIMLEDRRLEILRIMRNGIYREGEDKISYEYTAAEIASRMEDHTPPQKIYHHLDKLLKHNFIVETKIMKKDRVRIKYYQRTSHGFIVRFTNEPIEELSQYNKNFVDDIIRSFGISISEDSKNRLYVLVDELSVHQSDIYDKLKDKIVKKHTDNTNLIYIIRFMQSIALTNSEESFEIYREIADILINQSNFDIN